MIDQDAARMYLAAHKMLEVLRDEYAGGAPSGVPEQMEVLQRALDNWELMLGPVPEGCRWNITQEPVQYAQLFTRNGRRTGNAMIAAVIPPEVAVSHVVRYSIVTDMGNDMCLNLNDLHEQFEIGDFIFNEKAVEVRRSKQAPTPVADLWQQAKDRGEVD